MDALLGPPVERLEYGYSLFSVLSIFIGEPSPKKGYKGTLLGDQDYLLQPTNSPTKNMEITSKPRSSLVPRLAIFMAAIACKLQNCQLRSNQDARFSGRIDSCFSQIPLISVRISEVDLAHLDGS